MKINFWQIVGGLLILAGIAGIVYREFFMETRTERQEPHDPATRPAPSTLPLAQWPVVTGVSR